MNESNGRNIPEVKAVVQRWLKDKNLIISDEEQVVLQRYSLQEVFALWQTIHTGSELSAFDSLELVVSDYYMAYWRTKADRENIANKYYALLLIALLDESFSMEISFMPDSELPNEYMPVEYFTQGK